MSLRIAHLSDIHFGGENVAAVSAVFEALSADPPDLTIISGDLTVAGATQEFKAAAAWVAALTAVGVRVLALPGNHDTPELEIPLRLTNPWGRWRSAFGAPDARGYQGPGLEVAAFNTARAVQPRLNWSKGVAGAGQVRRTVRKLAAARAGALRVASCHHPLVEIPDGPMTGRVWGGPRAARELCEAKADLVLTGHIHAPFAMPLPYGDGQTVAVGAGTLSVRERGVPPSFNMIEASDIEIAVTAQSWSGSGLSPWMTWKFPRRKGA